MVLNYWLTLAVIFDLVFLPMSHIGPMPIKFSYVVILLHFAAHPPTTKYAFILTVSFWILATITGVGWIIWASQTNNPVAFDQTFTMMAVLFVAPQALIMGMHTKQNMLSKLPYFIIGYLIVNVVVVVLWGRLVDSTFGNLYYYYPDYLGPGTDQARAGGLHQNPHISSLFMSILVIGLYAGIKYKHLTLSSPITLIAIGSALILPILLASRSEILTIIIIIAAIVMTSPRVKWPRATVGAVFLKMVIAATIIYTGILWSPVDIPNPTARLNDTVDRFIADPLNSHSGLGRPLLFWNNGVAPDRIFQSPIIGSGGEDLGFHNDWLTVLAAGGIIGLAIFILTVVNIARINVLLIIPFVLAGSTNSFVFAAQHFTLFMIVAGIMFTAKGYNTHRRRVPTETRARDQLASVRNNP